MIKKAVIPIGGMGTRFLPASKAVAKEFFPIVDKPVLLLLLEECLSSGIQDVFLVLSPQKLYLKDFFKDDDFLYNRLKETNKLHYLNDFFRVKNNLSISFGVQKKPKGSGDAILVAKEWVGDEPFAVLFGDDINYTLPNMSPVIGQLIDAYNNTGKLIIGCKEVDKEEIHKYSSCVLTKKISNMLFETKGIIEKPDPQEAPSLCAGLARYILTPSIFSVLEKMIVSDGRELGLTEAMDIIARNGGACAYIFKSIRYDTGDKFGYVSAVIEYALRHNEIGPEVKKYLKKLVDGNFDQIYKMK